MIENLELSNFKSWRNLTLPFGQVTGLFGTNSSGKSSILQFLLMLKQTKNASDRNIVLDFGGPDGQLINLGGFEDVVHKHLGGEPLTWNLEWSLEKSISLSDTTKSRSESFVTAKRIRTACKVQKEQKRQLQVEELVYNFDNFSFSIDRKVDRKSEFVLNASCPDGSDFRFVRNRQRAWTLPGPLKTYLFPDQAKTYYQNADFLSIFESEYESMMDSIFYLGPLREYPRREYPWSGSTPEDVGRRGEQTIAAILSATSRGENRNLRYKGKYRPFEEVIAHWLQELGLISSFRVKEIGSNSNLYRAVIKKDQYSPDAFLTDVGFGVSQVLPSIVLMYYVPEGSTVIMEQPEIHLHPSVQAGLADVILSVSTHRNLQVIVESHSEHLLRRFQRRVAEGSFDNEDMKLYFCDNSRGESNLLDLEIDIFGEIRNWPKSFFGDELTEISETRKAALRRKIEKAGS